MGRDKAKKEKGREKEKIERVNLDAIQTPVDRGRCHGLSQLVIAIVTSLIKQKRRHPSKER